MVGKEAASSPEFVWDLDCRSALSLLTSSPLFSRVRKKRSLVNRGSSRGPEIGLQNVERNGALFPGSQSTSSGTQSSYRALYVRALRFEFEEGSARGVF